MKCIKHFEAHAVFGHLVMDMDFFEDLTFVYGLNGSGKTTALKLIAALLNPSLKTLFGIPFLKTKLIGETREGATIELNCIKSDTSLCLSVSSIPNVVLEINLGGIDTEEVDTSAMDRKYRMNQVVKAIRDLCSPIFLGIERRFQTPDKMVLAHPTTVRQMTFGFGRERTMPERPEYDLGLAQVAKIIDDFIRLLKVRQETADSQFRKQLLLDSFTYVDPRKHGFTIGPPDEKMFKVFRSKRATIMNTLKSLDLLTEEFETTSDDFFSAMEEIISKIKSAVKQRKGKAKGNLTEEAFKEAIAAWFVNQPQVDRIHRIFQLVNQYEEQRALIDKPLNDFILLVNRFFAQTGKKVIIGKEGRLKIEVGGLSSPIQALSSGERQILIMLAHLSLNPPLRKDGIFIVDEPELSLHMEWQDMFVESVQAANPRLQIILATHSPAIIAGHNDKCIPVTKALL